MFGNSLATFWHSSEQCSSIIRAQLGQVYLEKNEKREAIREDGFPLSLFSPSPEKSPLPLPTTCLIGEGLIKYDSYNLVLPFYDYCTGLQVSNIFMVSVDGGKRDRSGHNISSMRRTASSPDETLRRELKIGCSVDYFWQSSRSFICWWNTVSNAWYYLSQTKWVIWIPNTC